MYDIEKSINTTYLNHEKLVNLCDSLKLEKEQQMDMLNAPSLMIEKIICIWDFV